MRAVTYNESWPDSWKSSYSYDELDIWGSRRDPGYTYQYKNRWNWCLDTIGKLVPPGSSILDVAGASGNFSLPLAESGYRVTWNDLRSELAGYVKEKHEFGEIEFSPGNIFDYRDRWAECFDAILAAEVIEHVAHPDRFLACLAGMLKPGGRLFLTTPNGRYFRCHHPRFSDCADPSAFESMQFKPDADGHIFLLDRAECRVLAAAAGLSAERIDLLTNPLTAGHVKLGYLLPYLPARFVRWFERGTRKLPMFLRERLTTQMVSVLRKPEAAESDSQRG
jgi:2-polyprenyl-6-hydroxyphenyl methylase/3-demethylubiquinone-9 3-methyltransferase